VRADGEVRWVQTRAARIDAEVFVVQVQDVTEQRRFQDQLEHLASHDALTGLLNRRRFEEALEETLAHVRRHGDHAAVITLDIDNFKHVNDTYGHSIGDELLTACARAIEDRIRLTDEVARLGGDEFGVVLRRTSPEDARAVARVLLEEIRRVGVQVGDRTVRVTASAGLRTLDDAGQRTAGELLNEADMAMYDAKERGRDRLSLIEPGDLQPERVRARMRWSERIRDALEDDGFVLFEQPILRLEGDLVDRSELLIRMVGDAGEPIAPGAFLPVAERYGQIQSIDRWVVRNAIQLLSDRRDADEDMAVEVNLSGDSLTDPATVDFIVSEINNSAIDPRQLVFEVTETAAISNLDRARRLALRLSELGCAFALDDFGAGFASFAYLKHLPLDVIKIDGEFIRSLLTSRHDQVTVQAIVDIAKGLGKETVAEFVEDAQTLEALRALGVDRAQGYHVGRPRPALIHPAFA
jgi:diguanylate cyclase (GGDEF)-like protein